MRKLRFWLRTRGAAWATGVGAALVLAAASAQWLAVAPLEREVVALREVPSTRDDLQDRIQESLQRSATPQARLAAFRRHFASDAALATRLARLHALAVENGLELTRGDYRLSKAGDDAIARYRMEIPIQGRYPDIRAFALRALHDMPTLALEQLQFQRRSVADEQIDAVMVFNLFVAR